MSGSKPSWGTPPEALRVVGQRRNLWRTGLTALLVGTILFAINQLDSVLRGQATAGTCVKIGVTYLVPFTVANVGLLLVVCLQNRRSV